MTAIPRDGTLDGMPALLAEGYRFIPERCRRLGTDIFETRLMLRRAVCVQGPEAARMFYTPGRFTRRGALPPSTLRLLQDHGSAATLDGEAHRWRKALFLSLMAPAGLARLADLMEQEWRARILDWQGRDRVVLLEEVRAILCRAVCRWAGVPLTESAADARAAEFGAMIEGAGSAGPRALRGLLLRARTERWARRLVAEVREGRVRTPDDRALHRIAWHRDPAGRLLDVRVAAVELINLLRPTVAVDRFVVFAALALHQHPEYRRGVEADDEALTRFVQEVRRFYPFFPLVGGRVLEPFEWRGVRFERGAWVILDLHGTNHDPRAWSEPGRFRPERFLGWRGDPFTLVPQGGGDHRTGHRCPGEWATIEIMRRAVRLLATAMRYEVPEQDLRVDLSRMPAVPRSRFVIANVRPTA